MDITSILGPILALGAIIGGLIIEGGAIGSIIAPTGAMIVFGGAFGAILVAYPLPDVISAMKALQTFLNGDTLLVLEPLEDIQKAVIEYRVKTLEKLRLP